MRHRPGAQAHYPQTKKIMKLATLLASIVLLLFMATNVVAHPGHKPGPVGDAPMPPPSPPPPSPSTPMPPPSPPAPSPASAPMPPPAPPPPSAMNDLWRSVGRPGREVI